MVFVVFVDPFLVCSPVLPRATLNFDFGAIFATIVIVPFSFIMDPCNFMMIAQSADRKFMSNSFDKPENKKCCNAGEGKNKK